MYWSKNVFVRTIDLSQLRSDIENNATPEVQEILQPMLKDYEKLLETGGKRIETPQEKYRVIIRSIRRLQRLSPEQEREAVRYSFNLNPHLFARVLWDNVQVLSEFNLKLDFKQLFELSVEFILKRDIHFSKSEKTGLKLIWDAPDLPTKTAIRKGLKMLRGKLPKDFTEGTLLNAISTARKEFDFNFFVQPDYYRMGLSFFNAILFIDYGQYPQISIEHPYLEKVTAFYDFPRLSNALNVALHIPEGREDDLSASVKQNPMVKRAYFFKVDHEYRVSNALWFELKNDRWFVREDQIFTLLFSVPDESLDQLVDYQPNTTLYYWREPYESFPDRGERQMETIDQEILRLIENINPSILSRERIFRPTPWSTYLYVQDFVSRRTVNRLWDELFETKILQWYVDVEPMTPYLYTFWIRDPSFHQQIAIKLLLDYIPNAYISIGRDLHDPYVIHMYGEITIPRETRLPHMLNEYFSRTAEERTVWVSGVRKVMPFAPFRLSSRWNEEEKKWRWDDEMSEIQIEPIE